MRIKSGWWLVTGGRWGRGRMGYSLVEMLVVISVMAVLASCTAVALHGMYRADRAARRELEASASISRLAARLRTDAHAAASAEVNEGLLTLKLGEAGSVSYELAAGRVERLVRQDDKIEHRDAFRLAVDAAGQWHVAKQEGATFVSLQLERSEGKPSRIDAQVGRARRFESAGEPMP
jgi:prepilin-type N-terminal cleavage/methylation domain-containing protein